MTARDSDLVIANLAAVHSENGIFDAQLHTAAGVFAAIACAMGNLTVPRSIAVLLAVAQGELGSIGITGHANLYNIPICFQYNAVAVETEVDVTGNLNRRIKFQIAGQIPVTLCEQVIAV